MSLTAMPRPEMVVILPNRKPFSTRRSGYGNKLTLFIITLIFEVPSYSPYSEKNNQKCCKYFHTPYQRRKFCKGHFYGTSLKQGIISLIFFVIFNSNFFSFLDSFLSNYTETTAGDFIALKEEFYNIFSRR